ncbi:MAG: hypothetical protein E7668_00865 [Ruminococcaceae bacterium]|nr:hypothetical protein [Oscillospiraceae bacterium]
MTLALLLSLITVLLLIVSILFLPQISVGKRHITLKIYPWIPLMGALLMLILGTVRRADVFTAFTEASSVNPIRILILFFSMTIFSLLLEQTGFFEHISGVILQKAGHSQHKIFLALYAIISLLTVFTSNDIVILTFTPFICHFCRSAKIDPIPYLIMEFVAANTWSLFLLIGNPTNIYVSGAFHIGFADYIRVMALPTVAAGLTSLLIMSVIFQKKLKGQIHADTVIEPITDRVLMWVTLVHLGACVILLSISQYLHFEMWLIALCMAISSVVCSILALVLRRKPMTCVGHAVARLPYEIVPFIIGMFTIVLALEESGFTAQVAAFLSKDDGVFSFGLLSFLASNILNNIPMSVLFSKILNFEAVTGQIYATIVGSNLGAFITPVGALAGIMWLNLLKQNHVRLPILKFVFFGFLIGVPTVLATLFVLEWVV